MAAVKFEQAMARLEAIVGELEKSDLPLDESLRIFEEGIRLSKNCLKILEEAEQKSKCWCKIRTVRSASMPSPQATNPMSHPPRFSERGLSARLYFPAVLS